MKYIPTGFTEEEADFMDGVPSLLSHGLTMIEITLKYNEKFNTDLYSDQFHDRFDDYVTQLANPYEEEPEDEYDPVEYDPVGDFLNETKYSMAFWKILQEYEDWRNKRNEEVIQDYMDIYNENMARFNAIMESMKGVFG